jgi:anti-sigma regulatory factor (Ser/Thr protein kinase)
MTTTGGPMSTRLALAPSPETGSLARRALRQLFATAAIDDDTRETAVLLANELVTNAVEHGGGATYLQAAVQDHAIRLEVSDSSPVAPRPNTDIDDLDERGRGLLLIESLASRWGVQPQPEGKTVWCELALP